MVAPVDAMVAVIHSKVCVCVLHVTIESIENTNNYLLEKLQQIHLQSNKVYLLAKDVFPLGFSCSTNTSHRDLNDKRRSFFL